MVVYEETKCVAGSCFTLKFFSHPFYFKKMRDTMRLRDDVMWEVGMNMKVGVMGFVGWHRRKLLWRVKCGWTLWSICVYCWSCEWGKNMSDIVVWIFKVEKSESFYMWFMKFFFEEGGTRWWFCWDEKLLKTPTNIFPFSLFMVFCDNERKQSKACATYCRWIGSLLHFPMKQYIV